MSDPKLPSDEIERMRTPLWEQAKEALRTGDHEAAEDLIDRAVTQWSSLQEYSINWITSLLTFIGEELDEAAVERALRKTGDEFVRPRRTSDTKWDDLPASARAKIIARAMVANFGKVEVEEDEEKIILSFQCGSGGRLIEDGRYEGDHAYLKLRSSGPQTFSRDELWVYCAHCSVNNEIQPVEWGETPTSIEFPPEQAGDTCVHHIYKNVGDIPESDFVRIGKTRP